LSGCFGIILDTLSTGATVALAIAAFKGLRAWEAQMKGTDKYKALLDIKKEVYNFHEVFQNARIERKYTEGALSALIYNGEVAVKEDISKLIAAHQALNSSIAHYNILLEIHGDFLSQEKATLLTYRTDLIACILRHHSKINIIELDHIDLFSIISSSKLGSESSSLYVYKSTDGSDQISQDLEKVVNEVTDKVNQKLKE